MKLLLDQGLPRSAAALSYSHRRSAWRRVGWTAPESTEEFDHSTRRIAALLALTKELDANYRRVAGLHTAS